MAKLDAVAVLFPVEAELFEIFLGVVFEFRALYVYRVVVDLEVGVGDFDDPVLSLVKGFQVRDLAVVCPVVAVDALFVSMLIAAAVDRIFENVLQFLCVALFDDEDAFSTLIDGAEVVGENLGRFLQRGVFGFEVGGYPVWQDDFPIRFGVQLGILSTG